ncbi:MAG: helix-turn-helix transcriptional regulator [Planctomycetota bacterium]
MTAPPTRATDTTHRLRLAERVQAARLNVHAVVEKAVSAGETRDGHVAPRPKLLFVDAGRVDYHLPDADLVLRGGDVLYRPGWIEARWEAGNEQPLGLWYVEWEFDSMQVVLPEPLVAYGVGATVGLGLRETLATSGGGWRPTDPTVWLEAEARAMLTRFLRHSERPGGGSSGEPPEPRATPRDDDARRWVRRLQQGFARPDVLDRLYAEARVSPSQVRRLFKAHTGRSPNAHLIDLRMKAAHFYLRHGVHGVKQAATAVGYTDPKYFTRLYRQHWGHPPSHDVL